MKIRHLLTIILMVAVLINCKNKAQEDVATQDKDVVEYSPITPAEFENSVIYELNVRQYSEAGTFNEFIKDIPELKELGVKIIWVMPIFPISETKRKATGDKFVSEIEDEEERKKYLGSYYAVSDFKAINPEFGTIEDFRNLVKTAHENGMYVILDWVPNHTGWDHVWLTEHPEFYTKNADGEITDPLKEDGTPMGWADVADLNYDNPELRKEMVSDMIYWIENENIDGFRCDVAGEVPTDFWVEAIPQLRAKKDLFMLAEAWEPELLEDGLFDMAYGWDNHHAMNHIAKGEKNVTAWDSLMIKNEKRYAKDDILMQFVTNHDENSWNGTVKERLGEAAPAMTALAYCIPGMPLIYSGQEYGLDHRLLFFEKDQIPNTKGKEWELLSKLGKLKNENPALNGGKNAAAYNRLDTGNDNILAFSRGDNDLIYIANFSDKEQSFELELEGSFKNVISEEIKPFKNINALELKPWEFIVLVKS